MDTDNSTMTVSDTSDKPKGFGKGKTSTGMPVVWYKIFRKQGKTDDEARKHWDAGNRMLPIEFKENKKVYVRKTATLTGEATRVAIPDEEKGDSFKEFSLEGETFRIGSNSYCYTLIHNGHPKYYKELSGVFGEMYNILSKKNMKQIKTLDDLIQIQKTTSENLAKFADLVPGEIPSQSKKERKEKQKTEPVASEASA